MLSEWHYRQLCIEISERGFRKKEPEGLPREMSMVLAKVHAALEEDGIANADVALELNIRPTELDGLVFGLAPHAFAGPKERGPRTGAPMHGGLHLVRSQSSGERYDDSATDEDVDISHTPDDDGVSLDADANDTQRGASVDFSVELVEGLAGSGLPLDQEVE